MVIALTTFLASDLVLIGSRTSGVVELPIIIPLIAVSALGLESIANSIINPLGQLSGLRLVAPRVCEAYFALGIVGFT